MKSLQI